MPRDRLPTASQVFADLPPPIPGDDRLRQSIRAIRATDGLLLGVLDDDPTGSQAVHGVQVVTVLEEAAYQAAFGAAPVCFVLTNTRSLTEPAAAERAALTARPDCCRGTAGRAAVAAEPQRLHVARSCNGGGGGAAGGPPPGDRRGL